MSAGEIYHSPQALEAHALIRNELRKHFSTLARCRSTEELHAHPLYRSIEETVHRVLDTPDHGSFQAEAPRLPRGRYRIVAWNLERGIRLDEQIEAFRTHPYLSKGDLLLLSETDVGMARSGNRPVAQTIARALGFHYAFTPCYLSLVKGSGVEYHMEGENELGLHGNAIVSRYPIRNPRPIRLANGKDKMAGREKRLGSQTALAAEVILPNRVVTAVSLHLDAQSTQLHRREQMCGVLEAVDGSGPTVIGGDWNTSTHNSSRASYAIMGYWLRVFMGVERAIKHYLHPYLHFERPLFELLEHHGFDYRRSNRIGDYTMSYYVTDDKTRQNLGEWIPAWCFPFLRWALRRHDGRCPLRMDWFATRGLEVENPEVLHEFREGLEVPLSDHDPIGLDIAIAGTEQSR